ncbi:hypothetical protein VTH06DRAFT_2107 [Thermothelomyces fergusii]
MAADSRSQVVDVAMICW